MDDSISTTVAAKAVPLRPRRLSQPSDLGLAPNDLGLAPNGLGLAPNGLGLAPNDLGLAPNGLGLAPSQDNVRMMTARSSRQRAWGWNRSTGG